MNIISIAIKLIIFLLGVAFGIIITEYNASEDIAKACDDAYEVGYLKGKEESLHN